jgi:hypothetical protein
MSDDPYDDQNPFRRYRGLLLSTKLIVLTVAFATILFVTVREYLSGRLPRPFMLLALIIFIPSSMILIRALVRAFRADPS